jgi:hypothetical protein
MNGLPNRTQIKYFTSASTGGFTGSIQRIYAPQGASLDRVSFGYHQRVGQTGSKTIITDIYARGALDPLILEKNATLEGPIVDFKISSSTVANPGVLVYSNNVRL